MERTRKAGTAESSETSAKKRRDDDSETALNPQEAVPKDSGSDLNQLAQLPRELRWMIIDLVQRQTGRMKRLFAYCDTTFTGPYHYYRAFKMLSKLIVVVSEVCKSWKAIVDDWVFNQPVPDVEKIKLEEEEKTVFGISFELSKLNCIRFRHFLNAVFGRRVQPSYEFWKHPMIWCKFGYDGPGIKVLGDILKINVDKIHIEDAPRTVKNNKKFFESIRLLLKNLKSVRSLKIERSVLRDDFASLIVDLVNAFSVQELEYDLDHGHLKDPRPFLLEIAANVKKITIRQMGMSQFLGEDNVDWVDLITRMFGRGANHIRFRNMAFPYISAEEHHQLIENLFATGQPFVFNTGLFERPRENDISDCDLKRKTMDRSYAVHEQFKEGRFDVEYRRESA